MALKLASILLTVFLCVDSKFYKYNITDFTKCKVYYARSGSYYKDFFEILNESSSNDTLFDFHFTVLASSDAHILLAPSRTIDKSDPVYEIVIGAGGNTFCDIRRMQKNGVKATYRVTGLLSALDYRSFWIHISRDGVIGVGKEGEELAFISWTDPDPLPLTVFSFSTWPGIEAKWYFDCIRNESDNSTTKRLERPLTPLEKLRKDYLYHYNPLVRPVANWTTMMNVGLSVNTKFVTLNEYKSALEFQGSVVLTWIDEKLVWNPADYNGTRTMHIFRREIWVPHLYLFNSVVTDQEILEDTMISVNSSGYATWNAITTLTSWCSLDDLGKWPRDQHVCGLTIGFFRDFQFLQLNFNLNESKFVRLYYSLTNSVNGRWFYQLKQKRSRSVLKETRRWTSSDGPYSSRWQVLEVNAFANKGWTTSNSTPTKVDFNPPALKLEFKLERTSNSYIAILITPLFVITTSLLLTFWASPFGPWKISFACLPLILSSFLLILVGTLIPIHSHVVPNLLYLYSYSLLASGICVFIEIVVINLSRVQKNEAIPHVLAVILTSCFMKMFLCLPEFKSSVEYGNLNEFVPKLDENVQTMWILLGVAIDRIAFFIYLGITVYTFCITY